MPDNALGQFGPRELANARAQPWRSKAVADFANRVGEDKSVVALVLEGPRGTALRAVGGQDDHNTASRAVAAEVGSNSELDRIFI